MFQITKVKVAGAIAAGALTLGGVGALAANSSNTLTVTGTTKTVSFNGLSLTALPGAKTPSTSFKNRGECVSFFAKTKDYALASSGTVSATSGGGLTLPKSYHGQLMSKIGAACDKAAGTSTSTTTDTETPDATESPEAAQTDNGAGFAPVHTHGHGHGHGQNGD